MHSDAILEVIPASMAHLEELLRGGTAFEQEFGMRAAEGLLEFDGMLEHALAALRDGVQPRWSTHLFVHSIDRAVIGIGGFTGPPKQGAVEIGYSVAPGYRGAGFATAAARRLVAAAEQSGDVRVVAAHTLATPGPSTAVLGRLGFARVGHAIDSEDGPIWRWERELGAFGGAG